MKISVNWLKKFTDIDLSVDELVTKVGAQLGAVEEVIDLGKTYQHIVIAEVTSCQKHPNADKLSICKINDGGKVQDVERDENGHVQVVCGAPNVREGLKVVWLPPGATVPSTVSKDPFVLGSRELRGVMSNGMIASAAELAIGDNHDGILELDEDATVGSDFAEVYELNDHIIDIENKMFTHRPDCFGILGVAREIAGIQQIPFNSPKWYLQSNEQGAVSNDNAVELRVENKADDLVPRFMAVAMTNVAVKPSPLEMQTYLTRVGLKPINNIVDVTNYIMYLTGQPLHAYDADKLRTVSNSQGSEKSSAVSLGTRMSRQGDKLKLLNGKELEIQDDSTVLIVSNDVPVGVGGVMGGSDTEVDEYTQNIVLECANFDMYNIRRTSMKYGLFTDAVTRFNKGQSVLQNDRILHHALMMITELSGGIQSSTVADIVDCDKVYVNHDGWNAESVNVTAEFINQRLGIELSTAQIKELLGNVEFGFDEGGKENELKILSPFWRTDIDIPEDIVEEVGRLHGFDRLNIELPKRSIAPASRDKTLFLKTHIRDTLEKSGANEALTYSFVHGNLIEKAGQSTDLAFELSNALSPDLQYFRTSLTPSLLDKVHSNVKAGYGQFALFEIGKSHIKGKQDKDEPEVPMEFNSLSFVYAADDKMAKAHQGAVYYQAKNYLEGLCTTFGAKGVSYRSLETVDLEADSAIAVTAAPFEPSRSSVVYNHENRALGVVGEYRASVAKALKLPAYCAGFEVGLYLFMNTQQTFYSEFSRYPSVSQDISLKTDSSQAYQPVMDELEAGLADIADKNLQTNLQPLDIYQKDDRKHFTFRLTAAHHQKTLQNQEINSLLDDLADRVAQKFGTERL